MMKLVILLAGGLLIAGLTLQLRQEDLELKYQAGRLHAQIEAQQARLWNQQVLIATYTAPNAIAQTVGHLNMKMVPQRPTTGPGANWLDPVAPVDPE
jgi:hypothetical protein